MAERSLVLFVPDDTGKTGAALPMMLTPVMGTPLLTFLAQTLSHIGMTRIFLVCHARFLDAAKACFPSTAELTCADGAGTADALHVFLSTAEEDESLVRVITGPCVCLPGIAAPSAVPSGVCRVARKSLMAALDDSFSFPRFLAESGASCGAEEGFYGLPSKDLLPVFQPLLQQAVLSRLTDSGVEIWDYRSCFVAPTVQVGSGTVLLPGTMLQGTTTVGSDCTLGPNTRLTDCTIGDRTTVNASQLTNAAVGSDASIGPFVCLQQGAVLHDHTTVDSFSVLRQTEVGSDTVIASLSSLSGSEIGSHVYVGSGAVIEEAETSPAPHTVVEDHAQIGSNATLTAPVTVGTFAAVAAGSAITESVPSQALGIARARQLNQKDWALKHKAKVKK